MKSKKKSESQHFRQRFYERVGEFCSRDQEEKLTRMVREQHLLGVKKQSLRIMHYIWHYKNKAYALVYDRQRKQLVTILNFPFSVEPPTY